MQTFEKQCQSCGMPLVNSKNAGKEKDGTPCAMYCVMCYNNGEFVNPNMTLDEMKKVLDNTIGKEGFRGKVIAWLGKMQLKTLKRWKR